MAATVAGHGHAEDPAVRYGGVLLRHVARYAAEVLLEELDEPEEPLVLDDAAGFESDEDPEDPEDEDDEEDDAAVFADDVAGVLLDEEPRLSFR